MSFKLPQVAVFVETSRQYGRDVLGGIHDWISKYEDWHIFQQDRCLDTALPEWFSHWEGDGVLFHSVHQTLIDEILKKGLPAVMLNQKLATWPLPRMSIPTVYVDPANVAAKAFDYLKRRGFRDYAYCGFGDFASSPERQQAFEEHLAAHGLPCVSFNLIYDIKEWESHRSVVLHAGGGADLQTVLRGLPKHTAVMCFNDDAALRLMAACRDYGIGVPQDLAILGVDNDPLTCSLARPTLTSIETNAFANGYEAARILHDLMNGQPVQKMDNPIPVKQVVERQSTEVVASEHPMVRKAVQRIRESAMQGLQIKELLGELEMSRNSLDMHFRREFNQSVYDYMMQHRLEGAAHLLKTTRISQESVARQSGFLSVSHFHRAFCTKFGMTPGNYRNQETRRMPD